MLSICKFAIQQPSYFLKNYTPLSIQRSGASFSSWNKVNKNAGFRYRLSYCSPPCVQFPSSYAIYYRSAPPQKFHDGRMALIELYYPDICIFWIKKDSRLILKSFLISDFNPQKRRGPRKIFEKARECRAPVHPVLVEVFLSGNCPHNWAPPSNCENKRCRMLYFKKSDHLHGTKKSPC